MKTACLQVQQHLQQSIFSYVLCQLSSKPADQEHVTSVCDVNIHPLTHICIISPILQKNEKCVTSAAQKGQNISNNNPIDNILHQIYWLYAGIFELLSNFKCSRKLKESDFWVRHICLSICRPYTWNNSDPNERLFENEHFSIFRKSVENFLIEGIPLCFNTHNKTPSLFRQEHIKSI